MGNIQGMYCVYLRDFELAEKHFNSALTVCLSLFVERVSFQIRPNLNKNIVITVNTNLCLLYLVQCKHAEYYSIAEKSFPSSLIIQYPFQSGAQPGGCVYLRRQSQREVRPLPPPAPHQQSARVPVSVLPFLPSNPPPRRLSEEALNYAKSEDLFRLHNLLIMVCSLALPVGVDVSLPPATVIPCRLQALHTCINWGTKGMDYMLLHWAYANLSRELTGQRRRHRLF